MFVRGASVLAAMAVLAPLAAEPIAKKWRIGMSAGVFNGIDSVRSDSANVLVLVDDRLTVERVYADPRNDSSVFGTLDMQPAGLLTFTAQYAVNDLFVVEASVGYDQIDLGDVEVQVQFDGARLVPEIPFNFSTFRIPAGDMTRIPIQLTGLARFRPKASLNPYFGGGIGYSFIGFDPTTEFDQLSINMDRSIGGRATLTPAFPGFPELVPPQPSAFRDLQGARVDARDTFEWHVAGGVEYAVKRNWSLIFDLRWTFASRSFRIGFNDGESLGVPVPQFSDFITSQVGQQAEGGAFGGVVIREGGLVDGGRLVLEPIQTAPQGTDCTVTPQFCRLVFDPTQPDGLLDPGTYYVQGGQFEYDGISYQIGFRFTF